MITGVVQQHRKAIFTSSPYLRPILGINGSIPPEGNVIYSPGASPFLSLPANALDVFSALAPECVMRSSLLAQFTSFIHYFDIASNIKRAFLEIEREQKKGVYCYGYYISRLRMRRRKAVEDIRFFCFFVIYD